MDICFKNVMPAPLQNIKHGENSIWGSTFQLHKGTKNLLNAASGKGKTTFTHILSGIRKDYSGSIQIGGQLLEDFTPNDWANWRKEKFSFIFQDLQLFPDLTVAENLQLKNKLTNTFAESKIQQMLETLGIYDKYKIPCGQLSMGQQQRVAIIRALCQPFDWLVMDEPFSHLDKHNIQLCLDLIQTVTDQNNAGFIITTLGEKYQLKYDSILNL